VGEALHVYKPSPQVVIYDDIQAHTLGLDGGVVIVFAPDSHEGIHLVRTQSKFLKTSQFAPSLQALFRPL
jgi:hypothetical protein